MINLWFMLMFLTRLLISDCVPANTSNGFGFELLLARMDSFEFNISEILGELKKQGETINQIANKDAISCETRSVLHSNSTDMKEQANLVTKQSTTNNSTVSSCEEGHTRKSGTYMLSVGNSTAFKVYCEQNLHSGGWIVIQNRFDGSVDFYRNWSDYKNGFGNLSGEFWLGLEKIYMLTLKPRMLLVHLESYDGDSKFALYEDFSIGNESEKYVLKSVTRLFGTLEDSLVVHKGNTFTTRDVDSSKCVKFFFGAWWNSRQCYYSNLNGPYLHSKTSDTRSMNWHGFSNSHESLKISKMMIK